MRPLNKRDGTNRPARLLLRAPEVPSDDEPESGGSMTTKRRNTDVSDSVIGDLAASANALALVRRTWASPLGEKRTKRALAVAEQVHGTTRRIAWPWILGRHDCADIDGAGQLGGAVARQLGSGTRGWARTPMSCGGAPHVMIGMAVYLTELLTRPKGKLPSLKREIASEAANVFYAPGFANLVQALRIRWADGKVDASTLAKVTASGIPALAKLAASGDRQSRREAGVGCHARGIAMERLERLARVGSCSRWFDGAAAGRCGVWRCWWRPGGCATATRGDVSVIEGRTFRRAAVFTVRQTSGCRCGSERDVGSWGKRQTSRGSGSSNCPPRGSSLASLSQWPGWESAKAVVLEVYPLPEGDGRAAGGAAPSSLHQCGGGKNPCWQRLVATIEEARAAIVATAAHKPSRFAYSREHLTGAALETAASIFDGEPVGACAFCILPGGSSAPWFLPHRHYRQCTLLVAWGLYSSYEILTRAI